MIVIASFKKDGKIVPLSFLWGNGKEYKIEKVLNVCQCRSLKSTFFYAQKHIKEKKISWRKKSKQSVIEDNSSEVELLTESCIMHHNGLDIIPSNLKLSAVEISLISAMSRETVLKKILTPLRLRYDFILLDCLPSLGIITINALAACDSVIIPLEAHYLSCEGLELILRTISQVKRNINNSLTIEGIIFTKYQSHTNFCRSIRELVEREYGESIHIFKDAINYSIKVAEASAVGVSIFEHDPRNPVAAAYQNIALEVAGHE